MNQIQTAGQQRYYDFIDGRAKRVRTSMIVWASLLCLALISLFNNIAIALVLAAFGAALAVLNVKSQRELKGKLDSVPDKEDFFCQLAAPDVVKAQDGQVLLTKDYVLVYKNDIFIHYIPAMEKVEVGLEGNGRKHLFLTDREGVRHEIMCCVKGTGAQEEFDAVYRALSGRVRAD